MNDIKKLITEEFLDEDVSINDDTSLFRGSILDSVDLVQLVSLLEETFDISISPREILPANFDTLTAIEAFVIKKKQS